MMRHIRTVHAPLLATGQRVAFDEKRSWDHNYYSLDAGATWHRTKSAAWSAASETIRHTAIVD